MDYWSQDRETIKRRNRTLIKRYKLGVIDPPWVYDNKQQNDPSRGGITYPTLTMEELWNIPIGNAFEKDAGLVTWITGPKLLDQYYEKYDPISIIRNWGFRPVTLLFVWVKTNKRGQAAYEETNLKEYDDWYSGLGRYTNSNIEIAVYARKGKGLPRIEKNVKQLIIAPIGAHSAKPQEQYNRLDRLFGEISPKIELFARKQNPPPIEWDATGLDYDGIDIKEWITQYA